MLLKERLVQNSAEKPGSSVEKRGKKPASSMIKFPGPKYTTTTNAMVNTNMIASPASSRSGKQRMSSSSSSSSEELDDAEPMDYSQVGQTTLGQIARPDNDSSLVAGTTHEQGRTIDPSSKIGGPSERAASTQMHDVPMDAKLAAGGFNVNVVQQPSRTGNRSTDNKPAKKPKTAAPHRKKLIAAKPGVLSLVAARHQEEKRRSLPFHLDESAD